MTRASLVTLLALACLACGPARHPTPGGLEVEGRLTPAKQAELDARHRDLLDCIPPSRKSPPVVRISVRTDGNCDRVKSGKRSEYGLTWIRVPPSLGAAAHEMAHYYTGDLTHTGWTLICGDRIDGKYRRMFPVECGD